MRFRDCENESSSKLKHSCGYLMDILITGGFKKLANEYYYSKYLGLSGSSTQAGTARWANSVYSAKPCQEFKFFNVNYLDIFIVAIKTTSNIFELQY